MLFALGYLGIYMGVAPKISFHTSVTDWFLDQSLPYRFVNSFKLIPYSYPKLKNSPLDTRRILILQIAGFVERSKYYGVWILTEGASILTGLGFTGYGPSGVPTWNGAANVEVWKIEVPENFKGLVDSWNIKTNVWLRECVYKRVTPKGEKAGFKSSMLTYLTSAIWVCLTMLISRRIDLTLPCAASFLCYSMAFQQATISLLYWAASSRPWLALHGRHFALFSSPSSHSLVATNLLMALARDHHNRPRACSRLLTM